MIYTLDQIKAIVKPIAEKYRLPAVYLFGSYARGTAREDSDIDLLVDTTGTGLTSLFKLGALYNDFDEAFDKEIDMITVSTIEQEPRFGRDKAFRSEVMEERINVYGAA